MSKYSHSPSRYRRRSHRSRTRTHTRKSRTHTRKSRSRTRRSRSRTRRSRSRSRSRTIRGGGKETANVIFQTDKENILVMHMKDSGDLAGMILLDILRNYGSDRGHTLINHAPSVMGQLMCVLFNDRNVRLVYPVNPNGDLPVTDYTYKWLFIRDEVRLTVTHNNKEIFDGVVGPYTLSDLRRAQEAK